MGVDDPTVCHDGEEQERNVHLWGSPYYVPGTLCQAGLFACTHNKARESRSSATVFFFSFFFIFFLFMAEPVAYASPEARGQIGAAAEV